MGRAKTITKTTTTSSRRNIKSAVAAENNNNNNTKPAVPEALSKGRKRPLPPSSKASPAKRPFVPSPLLDLSRRGVEGVMLAVGQGDTGQLGLGESTMERTKPGLIKDLENLVDIVAGGMHSLALTGSGIVYSFGCNDEGSLGRETPIEEDTFLPGPVLIPGKVVMISAGDSHSVCLTDEGKVYYWGTFRDSSGSFGLTPTGKIEKLPVPLAHELEVRKISSGSDHIALLTTKGELYTVGCAEQGQLGRVGERFTARGGRRGLSLLLKPNQIHSSKRKTIYKDVWAGSYNTLALSDTDDILVCGLNNYNQLGVKNVSSTIFSLVKSDSFSDNKWRQIALGQHHTLALDQDGKVYALGRNEYGRLGLGEAREDAKVPTLINSLADKKVVDVSCGTAVSFAVTEAGECYSWGMGTNGQLAQEDDEDAWNPGRVLGKQLESRKVILASGGGQHTLLLAK